MSDKHKQIIRLVMVFGSETSLSPGNPYLHGVLKTELTRQAVSELRGLRHHQPNQIVGEQVNPYLLERHGWRQATQALHAQRRLDVAQIHLTTH